ncbi:MAG TPA: outer membrane beta-barrel protein [Burkholderiales bacterium]|jgi:OOP family OmpA-OmpF porin|nr:outer membrane beta-barrel protein [Burkholderiales bacterium]
MNKLFPRAALFALQAAGAAGLGLSNAAHAQSMTQSLAQSLADTRWYLGAGVGHVNASPNVGDYADLRSGASTTIGVDGSTAWKAYGGAQFTPNWGLELDYADLGKYNVTYGLPPAGNGMSTNKLSAWSLAGVGTWPINQYFSVHALAGLAWLRSEYSFTGDGVSYPAGTGGSARALNPTLGLGADYNINKTFAIRFDYQSFGKVGQQTNNFTNPGATGEARPALTSIGLEAKF